jgi:anti-sigma factor RsiW
MTCEQCERDLALAVKGDLPEREQARLNQHLRQCPRCQDFLQGLQESQRKLKDLADEPLEDAALAAVRTRVLAALHESARRPVVVPAWGWMFAASLVVAALGLAMVVWRTTPQASRRTAGFLPSPPAPSRASVAPAVPVETSGAAPTRRPPAGAASLPSRRPSTVRPAPAVSQGREPKTARVVPELSPDDAEQLARAVVAVSRMHRLEEPAPAGEPSPGAVVRLQTSDPGVVIYWQLDSNGG